MGDKPASLPPTLPCFIISTAFVCLSYTTDALFPSHSLDRPLHTFSAHKQLLVAANSPPTGTITSSGITSQDGVHGNEQPPPRPLDRKTLMGIVIASTVLGSILLSLLLRYLFQYHIWNSQSSIKKCQPQADMATDQRCWSSSLQLAVTRSRGSCNSACAIDYTLLKAATNNFSTNNLLGSGGSGSVYKACIDDGLFAAVKRLKQTLVANHRLQRHFQTEIELMSRIRHPNLVALLGYSIDVKNHDHLLLYELMLNGSLEDHLHGPSRGSVLDWNLRMKVALDAARGLEHLHEECNPPIIHRDFKSSNILLDASFNAKVSDFGLAILSSDVWDNSTVDLQGTFGYVAPEYMLDGIISEKSDVYAFGVVLLELITGRKPIDMSRPIGSQSLVTWAGPQLAERARLMDLLDPALHKDMVDLKHLHQVTAIAALCIQTEPSYRPLMMDVVNSLVPLVPSELGGAMRSAGEPKREMIMMRMMMKAGHGSPLPLHAHESGKSLSFSEISLHDATDVSDGSIRFSMSASARMA